MNNLCDLLEESANHFQDKTATQIRDKQDWRKLSYRQLRDTAELLARALRAKGFGEASPIAILSENRPEWGIAFFSILRIGATVVPLDKLLKKNEIQFILDTSETKLIFASGSYLELLREIPVPIPVISFDETQLGFSTLTQEIAHGVNAPALGHSPAIRDSIALMIFTSGTTGNPKGVMLSHGNLLSNVEAFSPIFPPSFFKSNFLSILPLNHCFELTGGYLTPLRGGGTITYQDSLKPSHVVQTMKDTKTQIMLAVPAFLEIFYHGILNKVSESPGLKAKFEIALELSSLIPFQGFRRQLFRGLHEQFGGKLRYFVSGGAPLSGELQEAFEKLGFTVIQGYGLTETSPVLTVNPFHKPRKRSVGKPVPGVEIKIEKMENETSGEIVAQGPCIMKGYYKNPDATAEVLKDGYLHTGDLGYLDDDNYLFISGRLKSLIVSSAGKKISPEEIEEKLKFIHYVKDACVLGRRAGDEEKVVAVVIPDQEKLDADHVGAEDARSRIWEEIKSMNGSIAEYKRVKDLILWEEEFPKTTTLKVKRAELEKLIRAKETSPS